MLFIYISSVVIVYARRVCNVAELVPRRRRRSFRCICWKSSKSQRYFHFATGRVLFLFNSDFDNNTSMVAYFHRRSVLLSDHVWYSFDQAIVSFVHAEFIRGSSKADTMYYDYPMPGLLQQELFSAMRDFPNPMQSLRDVRMKKEVSHKNDRGPRVLLFILKTRWPQFDFKLQEKPKQKNYPGISAKPSLAKSMAKECGKNPLSCNTSAISFQSLKNESKDICPNRKVLKNLDLNRILRDAKIPATTSNEAQSDTCNSYSEDSTAFMVHKCKIHKGPYCKLKNCKKDRCFSHKAYHSHMLVGIPICSTCHKRFMTKDEYNAHVADCKAKKEEVAVKNPHKNEEDKDNEDSSSEEEINTNNIISWLEKID